MQFAMPRVKPGERQRAKAPKVRTGCITCKSVFQIPPAVVELRRTR